ncbi:hypothetical protein J2S74_002619 [Evansella vedderi]|uniref:DUF2777 family protein n=1 Tax=Evansella vedderi TaxID=38282 RepID=A0ABT9ZWW9_9BACI|nr:DUF2777 family protein [Evansella vedderi]MDQ0255237.1 hypothetical protein [Evansella vedderi]
MDRKQAKQYIGEAVLLNEGSQGQYIGILEDMIMESKKPWRAIVRITGVYEYPDFNYDELELNEPYLKENDLLECSGHRIDVLVDSSLSKHSYDDTLKIALKAKWDEVQQINEDSEVILTLIQQELRRLKGEYLLFEDSYMYYKLVKKGRTVHIYDKDKLETLPIEGCPFEFEINLNDEWVQAEYIKGLSFQLTNGQEVELSHGSTVRLNKNQFDPYQILLNELEEPSLHALERGLKKFGIGHEHSVFCHNSLLVQLLSSLNQKNVTGVNFISYSKGKNQFVVQHHYERTFRDKEDDITFDRFEFTSDNGERVLTTFATQFSQD